MIPLLDKTKLIITGAAGRIGYAVSKEALRLGASVLMVDITNERLQILAKELEQSFPGKVYTYNCDITKTEEITAMIQFAILCMGGVTSAVHSAYPVTQNWGTKFEDLTSEIVNEHLSNQLGSCIMLSQVILSHFKQQGGGNLIHISSIQGISAPKFTHYEGTDMTSPLEYSAIKAGVISLTKWLARYYSGYSIRVNCVSPGGILAGQPETFLKRYRESCTNFGMLTSNQVAGTICFLLSTQSEAINGQNIIIDDGWSL